MSGGIVKYFEMDGYGRKLNRVLYAFSGNELPDPVDGADWRLDMAFDRGTEILSAPQLKEKFSEGSEKWIRERSRRRTSAQGEGANDEIKAIRRATGRG
jgi:hypothetical protein